MEYAVRFFRDNGNMVVVRITNIKDLKTLMNGDAKNSEIETKVGNSMSERMHNLIAFHNENIKKRNPLKS